jgi:recombinational DNA repair ATPase RecF
MVNNEKNRLKEIIDFSNGKSIQNLTWKNIPDFAVITGLNGSGKTQLLEAIAMENNNLSSSSFVYLNNRPQIHHQKVYEKPGVNAAEFKTSKIEELQTRIYNNLKRFLNVDRIEEDTHGLLLINSSGSIFPQTTMFLQTKLLHTNHKKEERAALNLIDECVAYFSKKNPASVHELNNWKDKVTFIGTLSEHQIQEFVATSFLDDNTPSSINIQSIFLQYQKTVNSLKADAYDSQKSKEVCDKEINEKLKEKFGCSEPPWEIINQQFEKYGFRHEVSKPIERSEFYFLHFGDGITYEQLSSGEQVIFHLIASAYEHAGSLEGKNELLLLDEFDAHLNPTMSKMYVEIVKDVLVGKFGMQVIMTTHSPSTVAYLPEANLFWMSEGKIKEKTKDDILKMLSPGLSLFQHKDELIIGKLVACLSNTKNKKVLLVEGENDKLGLTKAIKALKKNDLSELDIIPCGCASKIPMHYRILNAINQEGINVVALFDDDEAGRNAKSDLKKDSKALFLQMPVETKQLKRQLTNEDSPSWSMEFLFPKSVLDQYDLLEENKRLSRESWDNLEKIDHNDIWRFKYRLKTDMEFKSVKEKLFENIEETEENFKDFKLTLKAIAEKFTTTPSTA